LRRSRLGWSRLLAPLRLSLLALRRRGRLLGRARLTGLRRAAGRRPTLLTFLLLRGAGRLTLRARRTAFLLRALRALRRLRALGSRTLGLRLRTFGWLLLLALVLAPLLARLLRLGLCELLRRGRRCHLRGDRAAAEHKRGKDRGRKERAFRGKEIHMPASLNGSGGAHATQSCSE
jgi:hypothetical protein